MMERKVGEPTEKVQSRCNDSDASTLNMIRTQVRMTGQRGSRALNIKGKQLENEKI